MDDDYWDETEQKGFNFNDEEETSQFAKSALGDPSTLHYFGFEEYAEKRTLSPHVSTSVSPSTSSYRTTPTESGVIFINATKKATLLSFEPKVIESTDRFASPDKTIKQMILGQPFYLEQYKAKEDKIELLDEAIKSHDGNAITSVIVFLKKTLKPSIFNRELLQRPEAISHYLRYLQFQHDKTELFDTYPILGRSSDAAMLKYKSALMIPNPDNKIAHLKNCYTTHFQSEPTLSFPAFLIQDQISLLQRQLPIEEEDLRQEREGTNPLFKHLPRTASLVNTSVITTLYYCCLYHYHLAENFLASPHAIQKEFKLTKKQFTWTALSALARMEQWKEIDHLFQIKSWLGGTKMKCCIGFHKVAELLHRLKAPHQEIVRYLRLVENTELRLELAKKFKSHQLVVDTYVNMRDRQGLEAYKRLLIPHTSDFLYLQTALKSSTIKWKN